MDDHAGMGARGVCDEQGRGSCSAVDGVVAATQLRHPIKPAVDSGLIREGAVTHGKADLVATQADRLLGVNLVVGVRAQIARRGP